MHESSHTPDRNWVVFQYTFRVYMQLIDLSFLSNPAVLVQELCMKYCLLEVVTWHEHSINICSTVPLQQQFRLLVMLCPMYGRYYTSCCCRVLQADVG